MKMSRHVAVIFLITATVILPGCTSSATTSAPSSTPEKKEGVSPAKSNETRIIDPTASGENNSEALKDAWRRFTLSGQYRLAQKEDMRFSEAARQKMGLDERVLYIPYVYIWGDLAYKKRTEDNHLAAIVIDTTQTDENRFGLVIFSPPEGSREYKVHWLYRGRDLSKYSVHRASGSFFVTEHLDDGSRNTCMVYWYRSRKQFECRPPEVTR